MALSAQNQSTSYVNLYYSIVQRAATRYFKEYYNSGEYQTFNVYAHIMHTRYAASLSSQVHATRIRSGGFAGERGCSARFAPRITRLSALPVLSPLGPLPVVSPTRELYPSCLRQAPVCHLCVASTFCQNETSLRRAAPCTRGFEFSRRPSFSFSPALGFVRPSVASSENSFESV